MAFGSEIYADLLDSPLAAGLALLVVGLTVAGSARLTHWSPVEHTPIVAPRAAGQVVRAARRIFRRRLPLLLGIGLIFVPLAAVGSAAQAGLFNIPAFESLVEFDGGEGSLSIPFALLVGGGVSLVAYVVMTAATAEAMRRAEAGLPVTALGAYRALVARWKSLLGALGRAAGIVLLLFVSIVGIPWGIRQAVRWVFIPQACVFEGLPAKRVPAAQLRAGARTLVAHGGPRRAPHPDRAGDGPARRAAPALPDDRPAGGRELRRIARLRGRAPLRGGGADARLRRPRRARPRRPRRWPWRRTGRSSRSGAPPPPGSLDAS